MIQKGLSSNQLKLIAMVAMTADHVGVILFPEVVWLRYVGRLAFPIYAYMIAQGCRHTRSMPKYLACVAAVAAVCQLVYWFARGSVYQSIMVTFTLSIALCALAKPAVETGSVRARLAFGGGIIAVFFITQVLPELLSGTDYQVDYGFIGVLLPVGVYLSRDRKMSLAYTAAMLALLAMDSWQGQWFALLAVPLLALYNGQRGKLKMKWLFYFYYPAHLLIIEGLAHL